MRGQTTIEVPASRGWKTKTLNPCREVYGPGPKGTTCSACDNMLRWNPTGAHIYRRCKLRFITRGHATHHSPRLPSCARYQVTP